MVVVVVVVVVLVSRRKGNNHHHHHHTRVRVVVVVVGNNTRALLVCRALALVRVGKGNPKKEAKATIPMMDAGRNALPGPKIYIVILFPVRLLSCPVLSCHCHGDIVNLSVGVGVSY